MAHIIFSLSKGGGELVGDLTRHTVPKLSKNVGDQLFKQPSSILDLSQVQKVDTAGLAWLLALLEQAEQKACTLLLAGLSDQLVKLSQLSAVDQFLPIYSSSPEPQD